MFKSTLLGMGPRGDDVLYVRGETLDMSIRLRVNPLLHPLIHLSVPSVRGRKENREAHWVLRRPQKALAEKDSKALVNLTKCSSLEPLS